MTGGAQPCLRRQLIERAAEHLMRQTVSERDVIQRRLDASDGLTAVLCRTQHTLMLMEQRDGISVRYFS